MPFPPRFLDELRARLSLAEVVGRRVKLVRRGREFVGLCPFHNEKTPSFSVVEDKDFYHCFGCGAHGDVIGFVMQTESLGFLEAIEVLARQAGLDVPKATPEEAHRAQRAISLGGANEAACAWFEKMLAAPEGRAARSYLEGRGLDAATIKRFRLGFAPAKRDGLKQALGQEFPETLLIEAGLLRKPEEGGDSFDYFRDRVIFPIGDRAGRVIAFGGRVMGDGQPKYLNSPDTPLFAKGRVLYGWAQARAAASRTPGAIVVEGYMDVIALHRAGFATAVAPLGTALTEAQIEELWRLAPEPVLCFDGDTAGLRAAGRALERALPLLKPGHSLRFAALPEGEDPDSLVLRHGAPAMRELLERARPLAEVIWTFETAQPHDTPERRAALEKRLDDRVRQIAERSVQDHYREFFRDRLRTAFGRRGPGTGRAAWRPPAARGSAWTARRAPVWPEAAPAGNPALLGRRQQEIFLAVLLNHPALIGECEEDVAAIDLAAPDLDSLRAELLKAHRLLPDLDAGSLRRHLTQIGFAGTVDAVLSQQVLKHAGFALPEADPAKVRDGAREVMSLLQKSELTKQIEEAGRDLVADMTPEKWVPVQHLVNESKDSKDDGTTGGGIR